LTITFVYPQNRFRFSVVSNISHLIYNLFDDFILKYGTKTPALRGGGKTHLANWFERKISVNYILTGKVNL